ncbi:MAG: glutathione S- transferase, nitrogen catabolite repression regulator [Watsoniomyces obsoletus]|nr:MAG: glutathione S- transferase, nitrogen catabolite repression regulator [Watsoniomyces obsoletus]
MAALASRSSLDPAGVTAPWKPLFQQHLALMPSPEFVMATVHPSDGSMPVEYVPRLRTLIMRGFWCELPPNKHNQAPPNPRTFETEMPAFTTDVRMEKVPDLFATSAGHGSVEQSQGSGGGGPVEAMWWIKEKMTQWRIRGNAFVIGPDIDDRLESSGVRTVKSELQPRMRQVVSEEDKKAWSWSREVTGHFGNLNPVMRGSFKNPPPGTPVSAPLPSDGDEPSLALGVKVNDLEDPVARRNFRVVVIKPAVVEQLDLSEPDSSRRYRFTYVGPDAPGDSNTESLFPQTHDGDDDDNQLLRVRRKRKSESNPTAMIIVFYESEVQDIFEGIVRAIATARNNLRKGRMAFQMRQMTSSMEGDSMRNARLAFARMPRSRGGGSNTNSNEKSVFDTIDQQLEAAQTLSEHGAHQFLREGDCSAEICGIKKRLAEVEELARKEMEKLAREDAAKAEAEKAQEEKRREIASTTAASEPTGVEPDETGVMEVDSEG